MSYSSNTSSKIKIGSIQTWNETINFGADDGSISFHAYNVRNNTPAKFEANINTRTIKITLATGRNMTFNADSYT